MTLEDRSSELAERIGDDVNLLRNSLKFFQVKDDGTTGQITNGTATDISGVWDDPQITAQEFNFDNVSGELTVLADGMLDITVVIHTWNNANNRHELHIILLKDDGGGFQPIDHSSTYTSRNNTQDEGNAAIPNALVAVTNGDKFKVQMFDIGSPATMGHANVAGQSRITAKLYK